MRIAKRSADPFLRLLTATATAWVIGQVFINVGYVIGLLPVTGIQLPLISAGGTSTATTLFMIGLMANAARHEPAAVAALRAGRDDRMNRLLRLPLPEPYLPSRVEVLRERLRTRPDAPKKATPAARPAKAARPARKPAAPARRPEPRERVRAGASGTGRARAAASAQDAKPGTVHGARRGSGHHGDASEQRRAAAAQGRGRTGSGQQRRSRALEGQRHG
jgi:cell division protein FtsW